MVELRIGSANAARWRVAVTASFTLARAIRSVPATEKANKTCALSCASTGSGNP